jgi:hypothetical protein
MNMGQPTARQLEYIDKLRLRAKLSSVQFGDLHTFDDARDAIDRLPKMPPISRGSRAAIFAQIKETGMTKEDLYAACGIESLADDSGATEADAAVCRAYLRGEAVERYLRPVQPTVAAAAEDSWRSARPT